MEHAETAPVESVAFATRLLEAFAVTLLESEKLNAPLPLATPLPNKPTPQLERKTLTVAFALVVPATTGLRLLPGDAGVVEVRLGVVGGAAVVNVHDVGARALPAAS